MENKVVSKIKGNEKLTVTLALLRRDLIKSVLLCEKYNLEHEILDENNLKITIPPDSVHILFYIGQKLAGNFKG